METIKRNNIAIIVLSSSIFLLLLLVFLNIKGIYVQIGTPPSGISQKALTIFLIIVIIISSVYLLKDKGIKGIIIGIGTFFIFMNILPDVLTGVEYTSFSSPDNEEKFVVIERGIGQLYKVSNSGLYMIFLTDIRTDDGYKPFSDGAYKLEWVSSEKLIIHYAFDYMDKNIFDDYREISIPLK